MLAHFSHYLSHNQPPSDDDAREIKALREKPLEELSVINVEIERVESILDSLKRKRTNMQKSIDEYNTILAPVRRPTMDVWGVIFVHCLATHRNSIMTASEAPILLTHVCRDWRSFALSTPQIWSRMHIPLLQKDSSYWYDASSHTEKDERRMEARSEEVQKWLQLSAAFPLSISITPPYSRDLVSHQSLLNAIIQSSRRWQQLELGFLPTSSDVLKRILSLSTDDLCLLRDLRLHSTINTESNEDLWHQSGLFTAQSLRSVSIANIHQTNVFPTGIPPNWKHLNHLFIHSPIATGFASQMLRHCSNLVGCLFVIEVPWDSVNNVAIPSPFITLPSAFLPRLEFLSLQGESTGCNQLFDSIEAPSLRILDCHGYLAHENEGVGLFTFLQGIKMLKTFILDYRELTEDHIFKCCTLMPSVTHLVLGHSPKDRHSDFCSQPYDPHPDQIRFFSMLYGVEHQYSPASTSTLFFPSLEIFEASGIPSITDEMVLEFIMTRIDASKFDSRVSELKKVSIYFSRSRQMDIIPEALAHAKEAGINLELELAYSITVQDLDRCWSPSLGLSHTDGRSWSYYPHFCY